MAREDRKYGHEAINKKNDKQKRAENKEDFCIENTRHGEGKGEKKERYEKRDIDDIQEKRREEYSEKVQEEEKHSKKF